ncbi:hypothetical protein FJT64_025731 [Amphibalanus amphitrite]|uniref:Tc1-like transposase DDE domain-containing protein n=1 Tax=Amphibalanus amphitrite TaxID=1232801 RepID=A0A6A4W6U7_AMPAM|nr:hypothetical protein FJT64_025731 [Amphibalanus amphitrite]
MRIMHQMGFRYRAAQRKIYVRKESLEIVCRRIKALQELKAFRQRGHQIVYRNETFTAKNASDDYHGEMNSDLFLRWLMTSLLLSLGEPYVLVLDNAPYHSILTEESRCPTPATKKADLTNWLVQRGIVIPPGATRPELLLLCRANKPSQQARAPARRGIQAYAPEEGELWLVQVECAFAVAGISDDGDKFRLLLSPLKYSMRTAEELFSGIRRKRLAKLDCRSPYLQVELDKTSKNETTVTQHRSDYRMNTLNRLPYGISVCGALSQSVIDQITAATSSDTIRASALDGLDVLVGI